MNLPYFFPHFNSTTKDRKMSSKGRRRHIITEIFKFVIIFLKQTFLAVSQSPAPIKRGGIGKKKSLKNVWCKCKGCKGATKRRKNSYSQFGEKKGECACILHIHSRDDGPAALLRSSRKIIELPRDFPESRTRQTTHAEILYLHSRINKVDYVPLLSGKQKKRRTNSKLNLEGGTGISAYPCFLYIKKDNGVIVVIVLVVMPPR